MINKLFAVFVFIIVAFPMYGQNLETQIYNTLDSFTHKKNIESLHVLSKKEDLFEHQATTKEEKLALVILKCNKAYYQKLNSIIYDAISEYEQANNIFVENSLSNYDIVEYCLKPLGELYTIVGNYSSAENVIRQYLIIAEKENNQTLITSASINLSVVYHNIGSYNRAVEILEQALNNNTSVEQKELIFNNLSTNYIALDMFDKALETNSRLHEKTANYYKINSLIEFKKKNFNKSYKLFVKAKELTLESNNFSARKTAKLYVEEAELLMKLNKTNSSLISLEKAIKILLPLHKNNTLPNNIELYPENTFIDIFDLYAQLSLDTELSLKYYDLSFYVSSLLKKNVSNQNTKIINNTLNRKRSEKCISLLFSKYKNTSNTKYIEQAFIYAEKSKASVLKSMFQKRSLLSINPNDTLLIKEQQLYSAQEKITNTLIQDDRITTSKIDYLLKKLNFINIEISSIHKEITEKYPENKSSNISIEAIRAKLQIDNAILIEYFYGDKNIYQFSLTESDITFHRLILGKNEIKEFIHFFDNASIINNDISKFKKLAFELYENSNFQITSKYNNVIVIPDGLLNFIPFDALITESTISNNFGKMPFVVLKQYLAYNSSAEFYYNGKDIGEKNRILGLFPVYENTNKVLEYSIQEAQTITDFGDSKVFMNDQASIFNFKKNIIDFDIIHLSTHAKGGSFTQPASMELYDGTLLLNELYSLNISPKLVVLSACETGIGKVNKGEGVMSIARGFQYAGANNILFSLWQINDKSTSEIIKEFYRYFKNTKSIVEANSISKHVYLNDDKLSNSKKSPYYWASFSYYGNFDKVENNYINYYLALILILVIMLLLFLIKRYYKTLGAHKYL